MHVRVVVVLLLVHLLCSINEVRGTPEALSDIKTATDNLVQPVDILYQKSQTIYFKWAIERIHYQFYVINIYIYNLNEEEFETALFYTPPNQNLDLFRIIMKLLYAQSDRTRADFTSPGGPALRMYAFSIISKICRMFGDNNDLRKYYLYPLLRITDPNSDFYTPIDSVPPTVIDEGQLSDDPVILGGPYFDAIDILEGQLYNLYNQWLPAVNSFWSNTDRVNTMDAALWNMLVVLDFIMGVDDLINPTHVSNQDGPANYIYFMENNRVLEILQLLAEIPNFSRQHIRNYAAFLVDNYFTTNAAQVPQNRFVPKTYLERRNTKKRVRQRDDYEDI